MMQSANLAKSFMLFTQPNYAAALGLRSTMITESPRKNSLLMNRSRLMGCLALTPLPVLGTCGQVCTTLRHTTPRPAHLCPHLFNVFKDHIAVAIKGFDTPKQLAVVAAADQYLCGCRRDQVSTITTTRRACEFVFTLVVKTDKGPVRKSSSSFFSISSIDICCAAAMLTAYGGL